MRANNGANVNAIINPADGSENPAPAYFDNLKVTVTGTEAALINSGFAPNAEIVYNIVDEKPAVPAETIAETAYETATEGTDVATEPVEKGNSSIVIIAVVAVFVAIVVAVVIVVAKKKK